MHEAFLKLSQNYNLHNCLENKVARVQHIKSKGQEFEWQTFSVMIDTDSVLTEVYQCPLHLSFSRKQSVTFEEWKKNESDGQEFERHGKQQTFYLMIDTGYWAKCPYIFYKTQTS